MASDDPLADYVEPITAQAAAACGLKDKDMAALLDVSRSTVCLWRNGHQAERLDNTQRRALLTVLRLKNLLLEEVIARIELSL